MTAVLALLLGLAAGAGAVGLLVRAAWRERDALRAEARALERELGETRTEAQVSRRALDAEREALDARVSAAVKALSADALRESNASFLALAETKLQGYVSPLKESLGRVDEQVRSLERARAQAFGELKEQLSTLSERTSGLATALRTPHVRGRWGEIQLRRVVELAGMVPYCDFVEQVTVVSDDGRLRPDLLVRLPGGKQVVVDAKVPLAAYLDACEASDDAERAQHLAAHARQVRDHLGKLSAKSYWQQFADSPDYVVMFLPDEGFFRAAWEQDPSLVEAGVRARVHVASPTTLIVLLQAVAYGWQQETVAEDARRVHELGRDLYERIGVMGGHLAKLGRGLTGAVGAYNEAVGSLETRVLPTVRKLEAHVLSDKRLPELAPVDLQTRPLQAQELVEGLRPVDVDAA